MYVYITKTPMTGIQLTPNLRYLPMNDDEGPFGMFIVSEGDRYRYSITVNNAEEMRAAVESFQTQPAWLDKTPL